jgi:corrinoid protein of di/trimethylamine methyltransferase
MDMDQGTLLSNLAETVKEYDTAGAAKWATQAMEAGIDPLEALDALTVAIREVGDDFAAGVCFLPELVSAAEAMQAAMPIIEEELDRAGGERESAGKVVTGTVSGDIHNIGKSMLSTLLVADGFEVIDLGIDVPTPRFVEVVKEQRPDVLAMSALLTITAMEQKNVIEALQEAGIRDTVKVIVGGGAINDEFAAGIGADGYDPTAPGGVKLCRDLLEA